MHLKLSSFFGVCDEVCIPARFGADQEIAVGASGLAAGLVDQWRARVPVEAKLIASASLRDHNGAPHLALDLLTTVDDIFVESMTNAYFKKPVFLTNTLALLPIANLKSPSDLIGQTLRITTVTGGMGLEQFSVFR